MSAVAARGSLVGRWWTRRERAACLPTTLVMRSTLLGGAGRALSLQSIQRTKSLALSPELSAEMARGGTVAMDDGVESARASRPSNVEPTLSDEPVSSARASVPSTRPPETSSPSWLPPSSTRPSTPSAEWSPPLEPVVSPARRPLLVVVSFVVGALIALLVAQRLGAFAARAPEIEIWVARARAAASAEAWDAPPGENVREITDAALRRWPGAPSVLAVRREAGQALTERAEALKDDDRAGARHWARLAAELDPKSEHAANLASELAQEPPGSGVNAPADSESGGLPRRPAFPAGTKPLPAPSAAPSDEPGPCRRCRPEAPGGAGCEAPAWRARRRGRLLHRAWRRPTRAGNPIAAEVAARINSWAWPSSDSAGSSCRPRMSA